MTEATGFGHGEAERFVEWLVIVEVKTFSPDDADKTYGIRICLRMGGRDFMPRQQTSLISRRGIKPLPHSRREGSWLEFEDLPHDI
jgi:hypothetical protein